MTGEDGQAEQTMKHPTIAEELSGHNVFKLGREEGKTVRVGNTRFTWKTRGENTGYQFAVYEMNLDPKLGQPLHKQPYAEFFYVLEGAGRLRPPGGRWRPGVDTSRRRGERHGPHQRAARVPQRHGPAVSVPGCVGPLPRDTLRRGRHRGGHRRPDAGRARPGGDGSVHRGRGPVARVLGRARSKR